MLVGLLISWVGLFGGGSACQHFFNDVIMEGGAHQGSVRSESGQDWALFGFVSAFSRDEVLLLSKHKPWVSTALSVTCVCGMIGPSGAPWARRASISRATGCAPSFETIQGLSQMR